MDIKNKVALITGGASGLGFASAQKLIAAGAKIMVMDLNEDNAKKACSELNGEADYAIANVAEEASVQDAINKTMDKFGRIDIVLNCSFNIYHIFGKELIKQGKSGVFLNISTTYSETGSSLVIPSSVAKAGVDNLMRGLTVEWSDYNIRFVGIAPGPIEHSGGASKLDPLGLFQIYNKYNNPRGRMCSQDEISKLALYLTSNDADYINGEIVKIDGGEVVKNGGEFNFITNIPFYKKLLYK